MKTTYSWKRITDQQIAHAFDVDGGASLAAKLGAVTGYPLDKCLLALAHAKRRGLIKTVDGQPTLVQARARVTTSAER